MDDLPVKIDFDAIGKLTKPIIKLIEVISKGFEKVYEPTHQKKLAKAKAYSNVVDAISKVIVEDVEARGLKVFINQLGQKQLNIESIINKAIKFLPLETTKSTELPDKEWILDFFDLCQNCSNEEVQEIWAKLLADKVDNPNVHSRRLMHTIKLLEVNEARTFNQMSKCFCELTLAPVELLELDENINDFGFNFGTVWSVGDTVLIEDFEVEFGVDYDTCLTLEEIGLLSNKEYSEDDNIISQVSFRINDEEKVFKLKNATISIFEFTKIGFELFEITNQKLDKRYMDSVVKCLKKNKMLKK